MVAPAGVIAGRGFLASKCFIFVSFCLQTIYHQFFF